MSKHFYNWTSEDFTAKWDSKPYTFKAGSITRNSAVSDTGDVVVLEQGVVYSFAKALAKRELQKEGVTLEAIEKIEEYALRCTDLPVEKEEVVEEVEEPVVKARKPRTVKAKVEVKEETAEII